LHRLYFLIWGEGEPEYLQTLRAAAQSSGVENRVFFLGPLHREKWESLDGCDVGYCAYRPMYFRLRYAATASNKLMEYWAAGLPVLTNDASDFRQLLSQYGLGNWAPDMTPQGIRDGLHALIYDEQGLKRKSANALAAHRERFNFELQFAETLAYLLEKFPPRPKTV
jgi:glycosyltransferase involved in cell wall biosynthesis